MKRLIYLAGRGMPLVLGLVAYLVGTAIARTTWASQLEFEAEQRLQMALAPAELSPKIRIIEISRDDTLKLTGQNLAAVPRHYHRGLIEGLKRAGARVLVFDLFFDTPQPQSEDAPFWKAVNGCAPLSVIFSETPNNAADPSLRNGYSYEFDPPEFLPNALPAHVALGQVEPVGRGPLYGEIALLCRDSDTGKEVPSVSLLAFCMDHGISPSEIKPRWGAHELQADTNVFQMDGNGGLIVDWPRGPDFGYVPYSEAWSTLVHGDPMHFFQNTIVLVGNTDDRTVQTAAGEKLGTWVLAAGLNTMLRTDQGTPHRVIGWINNAWPLLAAFGIAFGLSNPDRRRAIVLSCLALLLAGIFPLILTAAVKLMPSVVPPITVAIIAFALASTARIAIPAFTGRAPRKTFEVTILRADFKDSTMIVSALGADAGGSALEQALARARHCIGEAQGVIVRTEGDGLVAMFPARPGGSHAESAFRATQCILLIPRPGSDSVAETAFRCGLESGMVHGSGVEIHGLPLHIAARLQALCAQTGRDALVGPTAYGLASHASELEAVGDYALKGIRGHLHAYALVKKGRSTRVRTDS